MFVVLSVAGLCSSCKDDIPSPEGLDLPALLSARAEGSGRDITLYAEISSPRIDACGFIITLPGKPSFRVPGTLEGQVFSASPENLEFNREYAFRAFITAGENEILSDELTFSTGPDKNDIVPIDDDAFKAYLLDRFDTNADGEIQVGEAETIQSLSISNRGIKSLSGIEYMPNIEFINCSDNLITELDVAANLLLRQLDCSPMEDANHNNLLDVIYIAAGSLQKIDCVTEVENTRDTRYIPEETIVCVRYDQDPMVGTLIETGGAKGIVFSVNSERDEALVVSVDEISGRNWYNSVDWCDSYGDGSWKMPDIDQLMLLHQAFYPVSKALIAGGFTPLYNLNRCYWSSTVNPQNSDYHYRQRIWDGFVLKSIGFDERVESVANLTRAVRKVSL